MRCDDTEARGEDGGTGASARGSRGGAGAPASAREGQLPPPRVSTGGGEGKAQEEATRDPGVIFRTAPHGSDGHPPLESLTVPALKARLRKAGLKVGGVKAVLLGRLQAHADRQ